MDPDSLRRALRSQPEPPAHPDLPAYLAGARKASAEAHLARCPACRKGLAGLLRARRTRRRAWAAAAALLLAVGALWPGRTPPPAALPLKDASLPPALLPVERAFGEGALLTGGSLTREPDGAWRLEHGLLLAESPGESVLLRAGSLQVDLLEGALLLERAASPGNPLLPDAEAGEESVRLTLLEGRARAGERSLSAPSSLRWDGQALSDAPPLAWRGPAWQALESGPFRLREASRILLADPPAQGFVLEAQVRKREAGAEAGILLQAAGKGWEIPVGGNLLPADGRWRRLRVASGPGGCRVTLGTAALASERAADLAQRLLPWAGRGAGLKAWGGEIEVRGARWRPLP